MKKLISHPAVFAVFYILLMLPTYVLPYFGSNSSLMHAAAAATESVNFAFYFHVLVMLLLVALAWVRGDVIEKRWLIIFPFLAMCFDLVPGINFIPLVPTVMHLLAIILGVVLAPAAATTTAGAATGQ